KKRNHLKETKKRKEIHRRVFFGGFDFNNIPSLPSFSCIIKEKTEKSGVQWYYYRQHHDQHMQKYGAQEYEKIKTNTAVVDSVLNLSYNCHERMVKAFTINTRPSLSDTILSQALKKILTNAFKETHPATALGKLQGFWYGFPGNVRAATDTAAKTDTAVNAISGWRLRPSLDDSYSPYCKESREVMPPAKTVTRYGRVSRRPERWGVSYF
ncbi:hypothetical protein CAPTEDRAFT_194079, partial [Capitella teleta]